MKEKSIGVGIIGAGFISSYHLSGLANVENAIVRVLCDSDIERARSQAIRFHIPETTKDSQEVFKRDDKITNALAKREFYRSVSLS